MLRGVLEHPEPYRGHAPVYTTFTVLFYYQRSSIHFIVKTAFFYGLNIHVHVQDDLVEQPLAHLYSSLILEAFRGKDDIPLSHILRLHDFVTQVSYMYHN